MMGYILAYIVFFVACIVIAKSQAPFWLMVMGADENVKADSETKIISNAVGIISFVIANIWFVLQLIFPSIMAFNDSVLLAIGSFIKSSDHSTLPLIIKAIGEITILTAAVWFIISLLVIQKVKAYRN